MEAEAAFRFTVEPEAAGRRLDSFLGDRLPECSRSYAAELIAAGRVEVDGRPRKPSYRLKVGECVVGSLPAPRPSAFRPEPIALDILYEDESLLVLCKPPGMVVHPAPGHDSGTLVHGLLHHCPALGALAGERRPGIVHRLDKETSGALVAAKDARSLERLAAQFKRRSVEKRYLVLVHGVPPGTQGVIRLPIGRDPLDRKKMSVRSRKPRPAETAWSIRRCWDGETSLLEVRLVTGRTHQIRVHLSAVGHPVVGDPVYGRRRGSKAASGPFGAILSSAPRQMLHAFRIGFDHPETGERLAFECPLPADMSGLIARLEAAASAAVPIL